MFSSETSKEIKREINQSRVNKNFPNNRIFKKNRIQRLERKIVWWGGKVLESKKKKNKKNDRIKCQCTKSKDYLLFIS